MEKDVKVGTSVQVNVLQEIGTPLKYFALAIFIVEGLLAALAYKATGNDFSILVVGMVGALLLLIGIVGYLVLKKPEALLGIRQQGIPEISLKYDVFLSSPMAAFGNEEDYKRDQENVLIIIDTLKQECRFNSVVYAGHKIESISDFDAADLSVNTDFKALLESKYFVMLYPKKLVSSVLVEAGWALALRKQSLYFVDNRDDLPFLLKQAEQAFSSIRIYDKCTTTGIVSLIKKHRTDLFLDHQ